MEKNCAQIDRASSAIVFVVRRFHNYVYRRSFTLVTDYKSIASLLHEHKATPIVASVRIQCWAISLAAYEYQLSRSPLAETPTSVPLPTDTIFLLEHTEDSPVAAKHVRRWTTHDPVYAKVLSFIKNGWKKAALVSEFKLF